MFSNLTQNSVLYVLDLDNSPKIITGIVESISNLRPKYNGFNPTMEMVVDITANINGTKREFKGVPNNTVADFGNSNFVLAENKEVLNSYISSLLQNSRNIVNSVEKHQKLIDSYEEALEELNPAVKADNKAMKELQEQVSTLQESMKILLEKLNKENISNTPN